MSSEVVEVEWVDTTNVAEWMDADELKEFARNKKWVCHNLGWVSYEDEDCIVVSSRRSDSGHWGLSERIPRQAIVSVKVAP